MQKNRRGVGSLLPIFSTKSMLKPVEVEEQFVVGYFLKLTAAYPTTLE